MPKKSFEQALKELESIVKEMESGELFLEESVKKYENGIKKSKFCLDLLDKTEKKINLLTKEQGDTITKTPFEE